MMRPGVAIALLLTSTGGLAQDAVAPTETPDATAATEPAPDPDARPPIVVEGQKEKKVCRTETSTGSIMPRRVCRTQSQIDSERAAMERDLDEARTRDEAEAHYRTNNLGN